jgi:DNA-directed RNA polymerase specialized sigma24 family protein
MYATSTEQRRRTEVQGLADRLYRERRRYLLRIAVRNAASEADAEEAVQDAFLAFVCEYDPGSGAPPLAWVTLATKRRCWRLRDAAHLDRRVFALPQSGHEEPTGVIDRRPADPTPLCERHAERAEARARLAELKPDERRTLGLIAAGYSYHEVGQITAWSYTKVNRCASEGRAALAQVAA